MKATQEDIIRAQRQLDAVLREEEQLDAILKNFRVQFQEVAEDDDYHRYGYLTFDDILQLSKIPPEQLVDPLDQRL